jgi:NAD(P)-dependent dehydrogenase (short-subunit alcohol dehydrogenase family)
MNNSQLLQGKRALVFGAGGSVGAAVAKEFAAEGAEVYLCGRNAKRLEEVKRSITDAGGSAHPAVVDALDEAAVQKCMDDIARAAGRIDIEFNAVAPRVEEYGGGKPAVEVTIGEYMVAVSTMVKSPIITALAAARHMMKQRSGVIIGVTGSTARGHIVGGAAIGVAFGALETFMENLAFEIGPRGVRALCLRVTANVDSSAIHNVARAMNTTHEQLAAMLASQNFLKTPMMLADTAKAATLIASDRFRMLTGTRVNSSAGAGMD